MLGGSLVYFGLGWRCSMRILVRHVGNIQMARGIASTISCTIAFRARNACLLWWRGDEMNTDHEKTSRC